MSLLLIFLIVGFIAMSLVFLLMGRGLTRSSKWLGVATLVFAAPFFFWLGALSESFTAGICYSNTIHSIGNAVQNTQSPVELAKQIHALPLEGYETVCTEVEAAAGKLPNAGAP